MEPLKLVFEDVDSNYVIRRAKVPGGWLVLGGHGVTFYPNPNHQWTVAVRAA